MGLLDPLEDSCRLYHSYCELDLYLDRRKSVLHSILLLRVVDWLEENIVPGK